MPEKWEVTPEIIKQVETYATLGLKTVHIADALGITRQTFRLKRKENAALSAALKRGKAKGIAHYANLLIKKAETGSVPSIIFFLKTQGEFIEKSQIKHTGLNPKDSEELKAAKEIAKRCKKQK